jgi:hypothetical protein
MANLENIVGALIGVVAIGPILGFESKIALFYGKKVDNSFHTYLESHVEKYGKGLTSKFLATWSYPGARLAGAIHDYILAKKSHSN